MTAVIEHDNNTMNAHCAYITLTEVQLHILNEHRTQTALKHFTTQSL